MAAPEQTASGSPCAIRPFTAWATSAMDSRAKTLLQGFLDLVEIGERDLPVSEDLLPLVPLARHEHRPAGPGGLDGLPDSLAPVGDDPVRAVAARPEPLFHGGEDGQRVLAARVVR